jgi:transposase-like protein
LVSRRTFSREFKLSICRDVESGALRKGQACRQHALGATLLRNWLQQYRSKGDDAFDGGDWFASSQAPDSRMRELEAALGRAHLEIELLKDALSKKTSVPRTGAK